MFDFLWNTRGYFFWLLAVSVFCAICERLFTWRRDQKALRSELWQDIILLFINGHYFGILLAIPAGHAVRQMGALFNSMGLPVPGQLHLITETPVWAQVIVFLVLRDFLEWCVHNLLHRVPMLWHFHKLHHSIVHMDFIGNFRFHWMESVIYGSLTWLPMTVLGVKSEVLLPIAVASTLIGHLNHSNVRFDYGPLRYIINSPRMHVWHHDTVMHFKGGQNFGVVFSVWDWIFKTAYMPSDVEQPEQLGFEKLDIFPTNLISRLLYPVSVLWSKQSK